MRVRRLTLGPLDTNCWLVDDDAGGPVLVIDPADEARSHHRGDWRRRRCEAIVLTHGHFDHLGAVGPPGRRPPARRCSSTKSMPGLYHRAPPDPAVPSSASTPSRPPPTAFSPRETT